MFLARVFTFPKTGVLDPQGSAIKATISNIGFKDVQDIQTGKYYEVRINACDAAKAKEIMKELCEKVLVNPVVEDYKFEIMEA
ncbi:phosphoribosylformylglycinamidine synthase subunit PurS [Tepidanaerobacter acetatoxydans]|uniref:phosphoribosylformylglycinamidine synthase subunit PurS n=1 Tax=Tepidanaerobacter acetatoxydans TaxID=499229 RepID=UPI001BD59455|nr:phosphoribosylformylglycinamidine synthase subunit PurS [Tepidanaerobacter acetatoxydans]